MRAFVWFICGIVLLIWLLAVFALVASEQFNILSTNVIQELEYRNLIASKSPDNDNEENWIRNNTNFPNIHGDINGDDSNSSSSDNDDNNENDPDLISKLKRLRSNSILKKAKFVKFQLRLK